MSSRKKSESHDLSRRERQIMQAIYRNGPSTVAEILSTIPDPPTPDSIRRMCHILEEKGHLKSKADGQRRVYQPIIGRGKASRNALTDVVDTFFAGSPRMLVAALLDTHRDKLSADDIARFNAMIDQGENG